MAPDFDCGVGCQLTPLAWNLSFSERERVCVLKRERGSNREREKELRHIFICSTNLPLIVIIIINKSTHVYLKSKTIYCGSSDSIELRGFAWHAPMTLDILRLYDQDFTN